MRTATRLPTRVSSCDVPVALDLPVAALVIATLAVREGEELSAKASPPFSQDGPRAEPFFNSPAVYGKLSHVPSRSKTCRGSAQREWRGWDVRSDVTTSRMAWEAAPEAASTSSHGGVFEGLSAASTPRDYRANTRLRMAGERSGK
ncbi:MAG: hypothetical protein QOF52_397, partial [Propionibacteriaceae bacterium]|nr:hypothetical protein [Propionibacteriaceae bacterium]